VIHENRERDLVWIKFICKAVFMCMKKDIFQIYAVLHKELITPIILLLSSGTKKVAACWSNHIQYIVSHVLNPDGECTFSD
jgi:hypothetical protein